EAGAPAVLSGAQIHPLDGRRGIFSAAQVEAAIRPRSRYAARSRLLAVEQITNLGGGAVWPLDELRAVAGVAQRHGLATHLDGARLLNAVTTSGVAARDYAAGFDSAWIDFSKGLGAPMGAVLAGSAEFVEEAWYWKQRLGGALRQAGIVAAAGIYALEHHVERLAEDHAHARILARGLAALPGIGLDPAEVEANIILFDVAGTGLSAAEFVRRLREEHGVRLGAFGPSTVRAITHLDISRAGISQALEAVARLLG
ncbi:MAG TPA: GntG family PLP-dependent aldolase, partial [Thermomicrobiales bacterium]|nr:GntG family PLP-dependent aldolase [Thermomicrobiales bacterium]